MSGFSARQVALIVGLVVGLVLGLGYIWGIAPIELVNTYPALLRTDYRWDWGRMTALSYVADGDLARARARLDGLKQEDVAGAIEALIEEYAAAGRPADTLRRLTELAEALDVYTPAMLVYLHTPSSPGFAPTHAPTPTSPISPLIGGDEGSMPTPHTSSPPGYSLSTSTPTPKPTRTPRPPTPTPVPVLPFQLAQQEQICEPGQVPHIEVVVRDERGAGLAGVEVWLTWSGGADRAVTGLKPQYGAGYADFSAELDISYALGTSELGMPLITDLRIEFCPERKGKEPLLGSWRIVLEPRLPATDESESGDER